MTRMIPDTIGDDSPPGEIELFDRLKDAPGTHGWVAFHSLAIAEHVTQVEGETDFVVLIPGEGVLIIEVKSHLRVEASGDGYWKLGNDQRTRKSPFDQASGSMHSIEDYLHSQRVYTDGYPVWDCVWFTAIPKSEIPQSIGWLPWMLLDADDLHSDDFTDTIVGVLRKGAAHIAEKAPGFRVQPGKPTDADIARLVATLEPRFVAEATPEELARLRSIAVERFSREQVEILDALVDVPRLLVDGPPGSGKSVVAIEAARRAAGSGKRVLVVAANPRLVAALRTKLGEATTLTIAELEQRPDERWDVLVVDDAQRLGTRTALDALDRALVGGLSGGAAVVSGDFSAGDARRAWLERMPTAVPLRLTQVFTG